MVVWTLQQESTHYRLPAPDPATALSYQTILNIEVRKATFLLFRALYQSDRIALVLREPVMIFSQ